MYSRSAELGDKDALYVMGVLHEEGVYVPKSKYIAANYYKRASELGQTDAKVNLAMLLMDGSGKVNLRLSPEEDEDSQNTIEMDFTKPKFSFTKQNSHIISNSDRIWMK